MYMASGGGAGARTAPVAILPSKKGITMETDIASLGRPTSTQAKLRGLPGAFERCSARNPWGAGGWGARTGAPCLLPQATYALLLKGHPSWEGLGKRSLAQCPPGRLSRSLVTRTGSWSQVVLG